MRTISADGLRFTGEWEGFKGEAYRATANEKYLTIGYGHYGPDVKPGMTVTREQALEMLRRDMDHAVSKVNEVAPRDLTQGQFDAVCDLVFNVGAGAIAPGTGTGIALRRGDMETLRKKLTQFHYQNGKSLPGLVRRATGRVALFDGESADRAIEIGRAA